MSKLFWLFSSIYLLVVSGLKISTSLFKYSCKIQPSFQRIHSHQQLQGTASETIRDESSKNKIPLPFMQVETIGLAGGWTEKLGNFLLKPPLSMKPVGVIHFLGGAFVGAAPHLTYRYLLDTL